MPRKNNLNQSLPDKSSRAITRTAGATQSDLILKQLLAYDRTPFARELSRFLMRSPTDESLEKFANKSPDRWAQAIAILARASGFTEKTESVNTNILLDMGRMSDGELRDRLESLMKDITPGAQSAQLNSPSSEDVPNLNKLSGIGEPTIDVLVGEGKDE